MFTGLIEATGRIESMTPTDGGERVRIATELGGALRPGDSIAVNGVCLTVAFCDSSGFVAELSPETLRVTTWRSTAAGRMVNLERPLLADARLGGHFVLGHVDGTGTVTRFVPDGDCHRLAVEIDPSMLVYVVSKGSIAVDGVSLTIASLEGATVEIQLVPFTVAHTAFQATHVGDAVNLECDVLGKYVVRLLDTSLPRARADGTSGGRR
jgi:riboflavin synthase